MDGTLGGIPTLTNEMPCMNRDKNFSLGALPSSNSEGTKHKAMMIPESDNRTRATQQRARVVV
jgi:hypothetical protein